MIISKDLALRLIRTRKSSLKVPLILTKLQGFLYIGCIIETNYSPAPGFLEASHSLSLGTRSKLFPKSTKAK